MLAYSCSIFNVLRVHILTSIATVNISNLKIFKVVITIDAKNAILHC